jgi:hypothetical protein
LVNFCARLPLLSVVYTNPLSSTARPTIQLNWPLPPPLLPKAPPGLKVSTLGPLASATKTLPAASTSTPKSLPALQAK